MTEIFKFSNVRRDSCAKSFLPKRNWEGCLFWHFRIPESVKIQNQNVLMFHLVVNYATVTVGWLNAAVLRDLSPHRKDVCAWGAGGRHWVCHVCWAASLLVLARLRDRGGLFISICNMKYASIPRGQLCLKLEISIEISGYLRKCCSQGSQLLVLSKLSFPCTVPCQVMDGIRGCTGGQNCHCPCLPASVQKLSSCEKREGLLTAA